MRGAILLFLIINLLFARTYNVTIGGTLSSGKYCSDHTTSTLYIPLIVSFQHKGLIYTITFPYEQIETKVTVTSSSDNNNQQQNNNQQSNNQQQSGGMPMLGGIVLKADQQQEDQQQDQQQEENTTTVQRVSKSGIADIFFKVSKPLHPKPNIYAKVSFIIKFANARQGLGTGSTDFSLQYDAYQIKDAKTTLFGSIGYTASGDAKNVEYQDLVYGSIGMIKNFIKYKAGVKFSHSGAKTKDGCAADSLGGFIIRKKGKYIYTYTASIGLSKGAADFSIGAYVSFKFNTNY